MQRKDSLSVVMATMSSTDAARFLYDQSHANDVTSVVCLAQHLLPCSWDKQQPGIGIAMSKYIISLMRNGAERSVLRDTRSGAECGAEVASLQLEGSIHAPFPL